MNRPIHHVPNPGDRRWCRHSYILWFGAYGSTRVLVYANGLDEALEIAADCLVSEGLLGLVTPHETFYAECEHDEDCNHESGECSGEIDHTYTEAGWIPSWEWGICAEDLDPKALSAYVHGREIAR